MSDVQDRSAASLLGDLVGQVTELFRREIQLLRAEINEKKNQVAAALGAIIVAAVIGITALNVLAGAVVAAIANTGIDAGWAALIVGGVLAIVAVILGRKGMSDLKANELAPHRTVRAVSNDAAMAKEKM